MEKNIRNLKITEKDAGDLNAGTGWSRKAILAKAKALLSVGGLEARREIVRTALQLDQLLAGGSINVK